MRDEIWCFNYCKAKTLSHAKNAPEMAGDLWTSLGLDADHKLIVSFLVGDRSAVSAEALMDDLARRLASRVQLTSDGHKAYLEAIEGAFGAAVDYAMLIKL